MIKNYRRDTRRHMRSTPPPVTNCQTFSDPLLPSSVTYFMDGPIQLKVLTLIYRSHIGQAPRYLRDLIRLPSSAISLRPLRSLERHDLFVPLARTSMAQTRAFAIIGPSLWNQLLPSTRSTLLTGEPSASFRSLKTALFSLGLSRASDWCALQEALYKCIDTIQYN